MRRVSLNTRAIPQSRLVAALRPRTTSVLIGRAAGFDAIPSEALIAGGSVVGEWQKKNALLAHRPTSMHRPTGSPPY